MAGTPEAARQGAGVPSSSEVTLLGGPSSVPASASTSPPRGRLYSLSPPETVAMNKYISESLADGIIRPSSSPAGAGFFFVGKRDGALRRPSHHGEELLPSAFDVLSF